MKKIQMLFGVLLMLFLLYGGNVLGAENQEFFHGYPSQSGKLHVEGNHLMDSKGRQIQLKGISTHGMAWFPEYINEECFRQLREEWKINVIRLAMYTAESGGYCTDGDQEKLKKLIREGVEYATKQDLYVIIDWHILSDHDPNLYREQAKDFFEEISLEYADHDNVIYEICNEPNGGTSWQEIRDYAQEIIGVIRENDRDGVIVVGTPNWSQMVDQAASDPIRGYENIMYTLHFYAATHKEDLRNIMKTAVEQGLPVFVTEYGICDASGNGMIDQEQASEWVSLMDTYGISYVAWNLSNKNETSAILRTDCKKTSGFEAEDLSSSGKWLFQMLTGEKLAEEVLDTNDYEGQDVVDGTVQEGKASYTAVVKNSWESNGEHYYQYELTIRNDSDQEITGWELQLPFSEEIHLTDGWNGDYRAEGNILHIAAKDYNCVIPENDRVTEVGFIISGSSELRINKKGEA